MGNTCIDALNLPKPKTITAFLFNAQKKILEKKKVKMETLTEYGSAPDKDLVNE